MTFEVEVKYRTGAAHSEIAARLLAAGAAAAPSIAQVDHYLSHPARDFAKTNEAFRIRQIGSDNRVTYKGPKRGGPTKTREEIEIPFAAGDETLTQMRTLFERLGFKLVASIRKRRSPFHIEYQGRALEIVLDEVDELGGFAEVEAFAEGEDDLPAAQHAVLDFARELGLTDVEPRSYLRMVLEQGRRASDSSVR